MLYLTEADVRAVLTMPAAIHAVEAGFRKLALDEAEVVPRQRCRADRAILHVLPAAAKTLGVLGFKAYTTAAAGARFHVVLYDAATGELSAVLEADHLGQVRTGAASAVATRLLARPDAATLGVFGTGKQARTQLLGIAAVRPLTRVHVTGRDDARRRAFAEEMSVASGVEVVPVDTPEAAARGMDIICTATASRDPVLFGAWVAPGTHVNLAGSNFLTKAEADVDLFRKAAVVVVDSKDQARLEAGDFVAALDAHVLEWSRIRDLAPTLVGRYPGRTSPDEVTVFKSLGIGLEDIAVGAHVVAEARRRGVGREVGG